MYIVQFQKKNAGNTGRLKIHRKGIENVNIEFGCKISRQSEPLADKLHDWQVTVEPWSKYKRREYDIIFVKPVGSTKMAVKLHLLASIFYAWSKNKL